MEYKLENKVKYEIKCGRQEKKRSLRWKRLTNHDFGFTVRLLHYLISYLFLVKSLLVYKPTNNY